MRVVNIQKIWVLILWNILFSCFRPLEGSDVFSGMRSALDQDLFDHIRGNRTEQARALLCQKPFLAFAGDCEGRLPIHWACFKGEITLVQLLIDNEHQTSIRDKKGLTPLHYAAARGHIEIIDLLLTLGARLDEKTNLGETALHILLSGIKIRAQGFLGHQGMMAFDYFQKPFHKKRAAEFLLEKDPQLFYQKTQSGEMALDIALKSRQKSMGHFLCNYHQILLMQESPGKRTQSAFSSSHTTPESMEEENIPRQKRQRLDKGTDLGVDPYVYR